MEVLEIIGSIVLFLAVFIVVLFVYYHAYTRPKQQKLNARIKEAYDSSLLLLGKMKLKAQPFGLEPQISERHSTLGFTFYDLELSKREIQFRYDVLLALIDVGECPNFKTKMNLDRAHKDLTKMIEPMEQALQKHHDISFEPHKV